MNSRKRKTQETEILHTTKPTPQTTTKKERKRAFIQTSRPMKIKPLFEPKINVRSLNLCFLNALAKQLEINCEISLVSLCNQYIDFYGKDDKKMFKNLFSEFKEEVGDKNAFNKLFNVKKELDEDSDKSLETDTRINGELNLENNIKVEDASARKENSKKSEDFLKNEENDKTNSIPDNTNDNEKFTKEPTTTTKKPRKLSKTQTKELDLKDKLQPEDQSSSHSKVKKPKKRSISKKSDESNFSAIFVKDENKVEGESKKEMFENLFGKLDKKKK